MNRVTKRDIWLCLFGCFYSVELKIYRKTVICKSVENLYRDNNFVNKLTHVFHITLPLLFQATLCTLFKPHSVHFLSHILCTFQATLCTPFFVYQPPVSTRVMCIKYLIHISVYTFCTHFNTSCTH